ncbi:MAG TPA: hypothetical protein PKN96_03130 [Flavobacterium sp.]|uniref:hypothetical protein n=1 Tax=Flavobacterium sp. TaxID=239 RepID=UPI002BF4DDE6|nr:hypothetical protein [Flavobacterium sp.]HNP32265.1 hypothetical protein [Flavobacterium sp.]
MTKINISIPIPCHENWETMTVVDKGKFCASCQKKVFDFTTASDREIINAFEKDNHLCGRFLNTQLNRDLIKPKEKSSLWLATTTALISLVGLNEVTAQEKTPTEQTDRRALGKFITTPAKEENILISGIVYDENKTPMPNLGIYSNGRKVGETDQNGNFSIYTRLGTQIAFRNTDEDTMVENEFYVGNHNYNNIEINYVKYESVKKQHPMTLGGLSGMKVSYRRSFFGRLFHKNKYK